MVWWLWRIGSMRVWCGYVPDHQEIKFRALKIIIFVAWRVVVVGCKVVLVVLVVLLVLVLLVLLALVLLVVAMVLLVLVLVMLMVVVLVLVLCCKYGGGARLCWR